MSKLLGQAVRDARVGRDWSQDVLAKRAGVSRKHISSLERGQANVSVVIVEKIARALGLASLPMEGVTFAAADTSTTHHRALAVEIETAFSHLSTARAMLRPDQSAFMEPARTGVVALADRALLSTRDVLRNPPPDAPFIPVRVEVEDELDIPIVGYVAAGAPVDLLNEDHGESRRVPVSEAPDPRWQVLEAKGDSMIEFGIYNGDLVYVEPRRGGVAAHGEIVIGWLNEGLVIKQWHRRGGRKKLISWNREYPDRELTPDDVWELQAIVRKTVPRSVRGRVFATPPFPKISG